jgi:hypothetical protein
MRRGASNLLRFDFSRIPMNGNINTRSNIYANSGVYRDLRPPRGFPYQYIFTFYLGQSRPKDLAWLGPATPFGVLFIWELDIELSDKISGYFI